MQEIILGLFRVKARVEFYSSVSEAVRKRAMGPSRDFITHENSNSVQLLPFTVQRQERTYFKITSGDIYGLGELAPIMQIADDFPVLIAVVNDEQLASRFACLFWHSVVRSRFYINLLRSVSSIGTNRVPRESVQELPRMRGLTAGSKSKASPLRTSPTIIRSGFNARRCAKPLSGNNE